MRDKETHTHTHTHTLIRQINYLKKTHTPTKKTTTKQNCGGLIWDECINI
jgi:hypothetical protein